MEAPSIPPMHYRVNTSIVDWTFFPPSADHGWGQGKIICILILKVEVVTCIEVLVCIASPNRYRFTETVMKGKLALVRNRKEHKKNLMSIDF